MNINKKNFADYVAKSIMSPSDKIESLSNWCLAAAGATISLLISTDANKNIILESSDLKWICICLCTSIIFGLIQKAIAIDISICESISDSIIKSGLLNPDVKVTNTQKETDIEQLLLLLPKFYRKSVMGLALNDPEHQNYRKKLIKKFMRQITFSILQLSAILISFFFVINPLLK